jgi:hypothetical protein
MAREGLRFDLGSAFQKALRQKGAITVKGLKVEEGDAAQIVDPMTPASSRASAAPSTGTAFRPTRSSWS